MQLDKLDDWLIDNWRQAWRLWSVYWQMVTSLILGAVLMVPSMPGEIAALVPQQYRIIAIGLWAALGLWARLKKQEKPPCP